MIFFLYKEYNKIRLREVGRFMKIILYLSDMLIPLVIFYIVSFAVIKKTSVYESFVNGTKDGIKTVIGVMPTLIGLMMAVGVMRASGFMEFLGNFLGGTMEVTGVPKEVFPIILVRMVSSSAATGLVLDIFKNYGTDSYIGILTSILMSCTETIFYTMSVYFMTAKVTKTRWTLAGALISTFAGIGASVFLARMM